MIEFLIKRTVETFLIPPGINILLILLGLVLMRRFYRTGKYSLGLGFVSLVLFSLPIIKIGLFTLLENDPALSKAQLSRPSAQAIVILGGGIEPRAPEYHHQNTVNSYALERLKYGAFLHKQTGLPILVSGGQVGIDLPADADVMQQTLQRAFHTPTRWVEDKSRNTMENAIFSQSMLQRDNINRVYLVTQAWHMPRSVAAFRQAGLEVIPAPMGFESTKRGIGYRDFLPSAHSLAKTNLWFHEVLGTLWYRLRY